MNINLLKNKKSRSLLLYSLGLAVLFLAICSKSSFLYPFNDWYDANNFLTMGKGIVHGLVPYRDLYEQKGPILYFLHSICYLIPGPHFFGVYLLETAAFTLFLYYAGKLIRLFTRPSAPFVLLPILSGLLLSAESFCQGDSAEELCAPLLMITLYYTLKHFRDRYPRPMTYRLLFFNGFLAGLILWTKYTLLGLHLAFMAFLFFLCLKEKTGLRAVKSCIAFLAGMALPAVPVLLYFAFHGALSDLFTVYFYNNIFLYDSSQGAGLVSRFLTILLRIGATFFRNLQFSLLTIAGMLAFLFSRRLIPALAGKLMLLMEAAFLAIFIYTGSEFPYYGYILCVFPVLGLVAITVFLEFLADSIRRIPSPKELSHTFFGFLPPPLQQLLWQYVQAPSAPRSKPITPASDTVRPAVRFGTLLAVLVSLLFAFYKSPNTSVIGTSRKDLVQYRFAAITAETEHATLLNYGFLDAGFYTVCNILPTEKYFQMQNISYEAFPEMMDAQDACIREQRVDYVIVRGEEIPEFILQYYEIRLEARQLYEGAHVKYTLLQKRD